MEAEDGGKLGGGGGEGEVRVVVVVSGLGRESMVWVVVLSVLFSLSLAGWIVTVFFFFFSCIPLSLRISGTGSRETLQSLGVHASKNEITGRRWKSAGHVTPARNSARSDMVSKIRHADSSLIRWKIPA